MIGAALASLAAAAVLWILLPHLLRRLAERRLARRCRRARAIVLSYDDGPGARLTPALLDLLAREGARASFFVLGRSAAARPALVRRALAEGHEVGSHTGRHLNAWRSGAAAWAADLGDGIAVAEALGGRGRLVRPPFGKLTLAGWLLGARRGLEWAWWTVDSRDSRRPRPVSGVLDEIARQGGGVVLMHDFDRAGDGGAHAAHCMALTRQLIAFARSEGYRLLRLGDLRDGPAADTATAASGLRDVTG